MMLATRWQRSAFAALLWLGACCQPLEPRPPIVPPPEATASPSASASPNATASERPESAGSTRGASSDAAIQARAAELVAKAKAAEPKLTPLLLELATGAKAEMIKLQHRLKTPASTARKLKTKLVADPTLELAALELDDSLRYTMRVDDEPSGHHLAGAKQVLAALESKGHHVVRLKNYWPAGDNYSGINGVLQSSSGQPWELQFHTAQSLDVQTATRAAYEELRALDTPAARKGELFDEMTKAWNKVPIPAGILEPGALHPRSEIRERKRP